MMNSDDFESFSRNIMGVLARLTGLFLLLAGIWVISHVLFTALDLYEHPEQIERFAVAIEQGSNIDKTLAPIKAGLRDRPPNKAVPDYQSKNKQKSGSGRADNFRPSYFFAWIVVLLLLLLIARISLTAIKTGGELILFDMQIKQFARTLVRESGKERNS